MKLNEMDAATQATLLNAGVNTGQPQSPPIWKIAILAFGALFLLGKLSKVR